MPQRRLGHPRMVLVGTFHPTPRHLLSTAVVLFWLVMTGALVSREWQARAKQGHSGDLGAGTRPGESYMAIDLKGQRIGVVRTTRRAEGRDGVPGFALDTRAELSLMVLETPAAIAVDVSVWQAVGAPRAALDLKLEAPGQQLRLVGTVTDGELVAELETAGASIPLHTRIDPSLLDPQGFLTTLPVRQLGPGEERRIMGLDPLSLRPSTVRLRGLGEETIQVTGKSTKVRRVALTAGGTSMLAWLDSDGELVRAELPMGLTLSAITASEAAAPVLPVAATDLIAHVLVSPTGKTPRPGLRRMVVRVGGLSESVRLPSDGTQREVAPHVYEIVSTGPAAGRGWLAAPAASTSRPGAADLAAEPLVQSDHPRIAAQAKLITGSAPDPWQRALAIESWVFSSLAKEPSPGVPSALEVLATRRGDCNEHAVLFTALARAVGIPTRIAVGVVWSEELAGFAYHAWPEVWVGRWVWMDPTFGQEVADATHLKLLAGGIESWPEVMSFLGRLELEVLELS